MKKLHGIAIFLLFTSVGMGQTTFSKIFGDSTRSYSGTVITSFHDSIYFSFFEQDVPETYQAGILMKLNPQGDQVVQYRFFKPHYYYSIGYPGAIRISSDGYLLSAGNSGPLIYSTQDRGNLFKLDRTTFDTIFTKEYSFGNISGFNGVVELNNGRYVLTGLRGDTSLVHTWAWLVETDTSGAVIWQKSLSSDTYNEGNAASPVVGGFYQQWVTAHPFTLNDNVDSAIFLDRYDNAGNLQWRDTFGAIGKENIAGPYIALKDGGSLLYINALDTGSINDLIDMPAVLYRLNTNGGIVWQRYFPSSPNFTLIKSMMESSSGNILLCGKKQTGFLSIDTEGHGNGVIIKLDKNGNVIFNQAYNYDTTWQDELFDITETADGGYASVGYAFERIGNISYGRAWVLKVDSTGCLNGNCPTIETGIEDIAVYTNFFVFPNPATSAFTIALSGPNDIGRYQDLRFILYDLTGRVVMDRLLKEQTSLVQREELANGLYLWKIENGSTSLGNGKIVLK